MKINKLFLVSMLLMAVLSSNAAVYLVQTTMDLPDDDLLDGVCDTGQSGNNTTCSLRAAIMESNASVAVFDTIVLPNDMGEYPLNRVDEDDDAFKGDFDITDDVTIINGTTAGATINGKFNDRVFHVHPGNTLTLEGINIINGLADTQSSFRGGAVLVQAGIFNASRVTFMNNVANRGGAIEALDAVLNITDAYFHQNAASDAGFTGAPRGSVIYSENSQIEISNSTLSHNINPSSNPQIVPISNERAAIYVTSSDLLIYNSTVANNYTGISFIGNNDLTAEHTTIAYNNSFGLRVLSADSLLMERSLIANNDTNCLFGSLNESSLERSGSTDLSCQLVSQTNRENIPNPLHASLNDWGGYAPTLMLYEGSQAIDLAGLCDQSLLEDQRGEARPLDGNGDMLAFCDMGAIEYNPSTDNDVIFKNAFD